MSPVIRISAEVYTRLEKHAEGFDSPDKVVERLLNHYENVDSKESKRLESAPKKKPKLIFHPGDEEKFLCKLVERKSVWVNVHYEDKPIETTTWYADRIKETSNLRRNIWSGRLRDWKEKGIVKAEFFFDTKDINQ